MSRNYKKEYKSFKEANPYYLGSFNDWKALEQSIEKRIREGVAEKNKSHYVLLNYYKKKVSELREEKKYIQNYYDKEVKRIKKEKANRKLVVKRNVKKVTCSGCLKYRNLMDRPINRTYTREVDVLKIIVAIESVLGEYSDLNPSDVRILYWLSLNDYSSANEVREVFNLSVGTVGTSFKRLIEKDLVSQPDIGKKVHKYFITLKGREMVLELTNKIGRRNLVYEGHYIEIENKKRMTEWRKNSEANRK